MTPLATALYLIPSFILLAMVIWQRRLILAMDEEYLLLDEENTALLYELEHAEETISELLRETR